MKLRGRKRQKATHGALSDRDRSAVVMLKDGSHSKAAVPVEVKNWDCQATR
jgi:hypothetical protein